MTIRVIERNGTRYAEYLGAKSSYDRTEFFSDLNAGFQFGVMVQTAGHREPAHHHPKTRAAPLSLSEFLFIREGSLTIRFHEESGEIFDSIDLSVGDAIILIDGIHSYRANSDFKALVVKQGPFMGEEGKILI